MYVDAFNAIREQLQPYLLVSPETTLLVVDGRKIRGHAGSDDYPLLLAAAYFIYNLEYVKGSKSYFSNTLLCMCRSRSSLNKRFLSCALVEFM